jgi:hypothetical protein
MIVGFLQQSGATISAHDEIGGGYTQAGITRSRGMAQMFAALFDELRAGAAVSFYEGYYRHFPEEVQVYHSFHEALERDERLGIICCFGEYELRLIQSFPDFEAAVYIYFTRQYQDGFDLLIYQVDQASDEYAYEHLALGAIPGFEGYYALPLDSTDRNYGFVVSEGEGFIAVAIGNLRTDRTRPHTSVHVAGIQTDALIEFIQELQFDEFLENWRAYSGA